MTDALPADRALNRDELDALACEWSDHRKAYEGTHTDAQRVGFAAGWTARHLHGYRPDPQARMMAQGERQAHRDERTSVVAEIIRNARGHVNELGIRIDVDDLTRYLGQAYDYGYVHGQVPHESERVAVAPEPPESDEPEAENHGRVEYGPAPAKRTLGEALLALDALVDEFASAIHVASLDIEDREDRNGEAIRDALGREANTATERERHGSHVVYPITRIFARAVVERLLVDTPVVLDIRPEVAP